MTSPDDRVPSVAALHRYRELRKMGLLPSEIGECTGIRSRTLQDLNRPGNRTISRANQTALFEFTLDMAREYAHPTYVDEVVFERMKRNQPCLLHPRARGLHIRAALARGFKYSQVMEYFRVSGATMKEAIEAREMSNA